MDLEDEIDLYCIRKNYDFNSYLNDKISTQNGYKIKQSNNFKEKAHNYIPLMIKHVQTLNDSCLDKTTNTKVFKGKIRFKNCLLYGKIMAKTKESKTNFSYLLDDGTGSLIINVFRKSKELETVRMMANELESVKKDLSSQNKNEMVKSLSNLLLGTTKQLDDSNIPIGSKVLVYGEPSFYRNQTFLKTYYVTQDMKTDRDIEITFKDCLIEWYNKNILQDS